MVDAAMIVPYNLIALPPSMRVAKRRLIPYSQPCSLHRVIEMLLDMNLN
jgi:hypothetical protein